MRKLILLPLLILLAHPTVAADTDSIGIPYARVLDGFVHPGGFVDYRSLKENRGDLDQVIEQLAAFSPTRYEGMSDDGKIAFWINAYNACTLRTIIDHYPIRSSFFKSLTYPKNSIRQIAGVFDRIQHDVMGTRYTLDQIENDILRKRFTEPRIHFALVCASIGCPPLRSEPYGGTRLSEQLNDQVRLFLADRKHFHVDEKSRQIQVSPIFKWFRSDFASHVPPGGRFSRFPEAEGSIRAFLQAHTGREEMANPSYRVAFLSYDWSLNEVSR